MELDPGPAGPMNEGGVPGRVETIVLGNFWTTFRESVPSSWGISKFRSINLCLIFSDIFIGAIVFDIAPVRSKALGTFWFPFYRFRGIGGGYFPAKSGPEPASRERPAPLLIGVWTQK